MSIYFYPAAPNRRSYVQLGTRTAEFGYKQFARTQAAIARAEGFDLSAMHLYAGYYDARGERLPDPVPQVPPQGRAWQEIDSVLRPLFERFDGHGPFAFAPQEAAAMLPRLREIDAATDWIAATRLPHGGPRSVADLIAVLDEARIARWHVLAEVS